MSDITDYAIDHSPILSKMNDIFHSYVAFNDKCIYLVMGKTLTVFCGYDVHTFTANRPMKDIITFHQV